MAGELGTEEGLIDDLIRAMELAAHELHADHFARIVKAEFQKRSFGYLLTSVLPLHVVTAWCGNTPYVALRHCLMTTDDHFDLASSLDVSVEPASEKPARNPARYPSELGEMEGSQNKEPLEIPLDSEGFQFVPTSGCPGEDSNLHGRKYSHQDLNLARLPIPPPGLSGR